MQVFARIEPGSWSPVIAFDETGCTLSTSKVAFESIWPGTATVAAADSIAPITKTWSELLCPLPHLDIPCWAYAMSYPSHQREVKIAECFRFPKLGPAAGMTAEIAFRDNLDYEAEIGLLMHRDTPNRFGFFMLNDLTDRGIQVLEHSRNKSKRSDSYSRAKSFSGALAIGPLIAIGSAEDWPQLEISLSVNGAQRQLVRAVDCTLSPPAIHRDVFAAAQAAGWLIAATGTSEGIIFQVPSLPRKLRLLMGSRFSARSARTRLLKSHTFLLPGDVLELRSALLGYAKSVVSSSPPNMIAPA